MKTIRLTSAFIATILAFGICPILPLQADEVRTTKTTTTTTAGTISEFGPERFIIRSETPSEPLTYGYTKKTTYVDENGAPVSVETITSGVPVTVYYTRDGDRLIANKVVVRRSHTLRGGTVETQTTRTTTAEELGRIGEFGSDAFTVRAETVRDPVRYTYTKTTTYVDESGTPVSVETVRSGMPVTVYYSDEGDQRIVSKVIVHKDEPGLFERLRQKHNESRVKRDAERLRKSEEKLERERK